LAGESQAAYVFLIGTRADADTSIIRGKDDIARVESRRKLQSLAAEKLDALSASRFRLRVLGKEVVVRDGARRIVEGILAVKNFVSTAVSSDPVAAVAWAGALIALPVGERTSAAACAGLTVSRC
jgi:hypothetical protein